MDREISKEVKRRRQWRRIAAIGGAAVAVALVWWLAADISVESVGISELKLATVDRGDVDATLSGNGTVVPAFEEVIISPIASRVVEVYHRPGDVVEAGTPLLRLDLEASRTVYRSEADKLAQLRLQLAQLRANSRTRLSDLAKQIEVARMKLRRYDVEYINERYLDSIGSGTGDRVREVELTRNSARLELEQLQEQLANETEIKHADEQLKLLEIEIQERQLAQQSRTLDDAEIRSPRRATVTSIADKLGATVGTGQQVASVADLGHYRIAA
ncbi:MAG: efflux RND transporter periplasmic adaptor subunit, partial [Muribaculaceae bacterium]|nr:efflux RND transporter periplasmic adaptor subunit [Muribaculaceae bacterium]